jgi:hypothetical protein
MSMCFKARASAWSCSMCGMVRLCYSKASGRSAARKVHSNLVFAETAQGAVVRDG